MSNGHRGVPVPLPTFSIMHRHCPAGRRRRGGWVSRHASGWGSSGGGCERLMLAPPSPVIHSWSFVLLYVARREPL